MDVLTAVTDEYGIFAAADAAAAGLSHRELNRRLAEGRLTRLAHGWYAVGPNAGERQRHILTTRALVRASQGRAVASHQSAAALLGLPLFRSALTDIHLTRVDDTWSRRRSGAVIHQRVRGAPAPIRGAVTPAMAAVQVGLSCGAESALIAADAALNRGLTSPAELDGAITLMRSFAGIGPVRAALDIADARIESPGESRTHFLLRHLKLPVELQVLIRDGSFAARVDFEVVGLPVIIEFDGRVKYSDPRVLFDEKTREDRLRELGYEVVRLTWADLCDPVAAKRKIMRAVARAKARQPSSTHPRAGY